MFVNIFLWSLDPPPFKNDAYVPVINSISIYVSIFYLFVSATGAITTARDLKFETNSAIDLYVTVSDGSIAVTEKLRVQLTGKHQ